jgi:translocation and assembly module TamB
MILRRALLLLPLMLATVALSAWFWLLHTQSGARWIWAVAESVTDGALSADSISGDLGSGVEVRKISFDGKGVYINVDETSLAVDIGLLPLKVTLRPVLVSGLRVEIGGDNEADASTSIREVLEKLQLPVALSFAEIRLDDATVKSRGDGRGFVINSATIAGQWHEEINVERFDISTPKIDATGSGGILLSGGNDVSFDATIIAKPELTGYDDVLVAATTIDGPLDNLAINVRSEEPGASLRGKIADLSHDIRWELTLEAPNLVLRSNAKLPDIPALSVAATGKGDLLSFDLLAELGFVGTDMEVTLAAEIDLQDSILSGDLAWQNAHWPVGEAQPDMQSHIGNLKLSGTLDEWSVAGTVELAVPDFPAGSFTVDGSGNQDAASFEILDGNVLGGSITGQAEYRWRDNQSYSANVDLGGISTAAILPEWPAVLSGKLSVNGRAQPLEFSALLTDVNGVFRDRPLQAAGQVDFRDSRISFDELVLRHGSSRLQVDGAPDARAGLSYDVVVEDLAHYIEDASGAFSAAGSLSLAPDERFLRIDASAEQISWRNFKVDSLSIADRSADKSIFATEILMAGMFAGDFPVGELQLRTRVDRQSQSIDLELQSDDLRSAISIEGTLDRWQQPELWTGKLTSLDLEHAELAAALENTTSLAFSTQSADIDEFCLVDIDGMRLCTGGSWQRNSGFELMALLSAVPVEFVNAFVDTGFVFNQIVSGEFNWSKLPDGLSQGRADIAMTPGLIVSADDPLMTIETGPAKLGFDVNDDDLNGGSIYLPLPNQGQIAADFEVLDMIDEGPADIRGLVDIELSDIGLLAGLFPVFDDVGGILNADINIAGTVVTPELSGDVTVEEGSLSYLPTGLKIEDMQLHSELQENGEIELVGSFRAGEGRAQIRTRADHATTAATGLELTLQGENLTVIDVPDVKAVANTDVQINFDGKTLNLDGTIEFPFARITPTNLGAAPVYESEDVVIVAGELPDEIVADEYEANIQIIGSVAVTLGNDIVVDLGVADTRVAGTTVLTWSGAPIPTANGRYDVGGEILAFGQRLEIVDGSVRFEDVSADDPYLRIRAEREIFGNTQVRRAGVLVAGRASRPTVEAYTVPLTTEERALTLLVTGSDFDYERGIGAFDFGTYVAPRVYASYGIGLFDNENVIRVRYDLKRGFGITATSGQKESGVDLSYRFEN